MRRMVLFVVLVFSLSLIWHTRSTVCAMPPAEVLGKEVDGIKVSLRPSKTHFVKGESIVVDLQITNVIPLGTAKGFDTYIPWAVRHPSDLYWVHAVDENGRDEVIFGGGKDPGLEVLHLPPGQFCGYRLVCGPKGMGGRPDLPPGKYQLYAVFKSKRSKLSGSGVNVSIRDLTAEQRDKLAKDVGRELKRIKRENEKLGKEGLWVGQVFSETVTIEVLPQ